MKKKLLNLVFCACFFSMAVGQNTTVPIVNGDFELPAGGVKITDINLVPGWHSDDLTDNHNGRESGAAYTSSASGKFYQVVDKIPTSSMGYNLKFDGKLSWDGNKDSVYFIAYFSAFSGADAKTRTVIDSTAILVVPGNTWTDFDTYKANLVIPANSSLVGDSLVIEFHVAPVNPLVTNIWANLDNVTLDKAVAIANGDFELPADGKKYTDINLVPGWHSDDLTDNHNGRENGAAYTSSESGKFYQIVEQIQSSPIAMAYQLKFDAKLTWDGNKDTVNFIAYFSSFTGSDPTTRTVIDSSVFTLVPTNTWTDYETYKANLVIAPNSTLAGNTLVVEFREAAKNPSVTNIWANFDNISITKVVSIYNGDFTLPDDGVKYTDINLVPGWHSDDLTDNHNGRENGAAYTSSASGKFYQIVEPIASSAIEYQLKFDGKLNWDGNKDSINFIAYFSSFSGNDVSTRTVIDSMAFLVVPGNTWTDFETFTALLPVPDSASYAGQTLVVEFRIAPVNPSVTNVWAGIDNVQIAKAKSFEPEWSTFPITHVVVGTVDNAKDFTGNVSLRWDADSLYMIYSIVDDSIVNKGTAYQVDNIEIYIDMANSKNIHWPRNGGWVKNVDDAFDATDYQFRLVPNVAFSVNNTPRPASASISSGSVKQTYERTADGYKFTLSVAWDSLSPAFVPAIGKDIGFDVLVSDNDKIASDANRNQITWNSLTANPYNDPSIWGTLELKDGGIFKQILDTEAPTKPANVAGDTIKATGTTADVKFTWDASTDNRVVQNYIVYNGSTPLDTILAKQTGNSFTIKGLAPGKITFGVVAVDIYGNASAKATKAITVAVRTGLNSLNVASLKMYPSPVTERLNIKSDDVINSVTIYGIDGRIALQQTVSSSKVELNVNNLNKGMYLVKVSTSKGISTQSIIKQ